MNISFYVLEKEIIEILINWKINIMVILFEIQIIKLYFIKPRLWIIKKEEKRKNANNIIYSFIYSNTKNNK